MGRLVVDEVLLDAVWVTPFAGGRVRLLLLLLLGGSRFLFGLRLEPNEAPNCLNREFIRSIHLSWLQRRALDQHEGLKRLGLKVWVTVEGVFGTTEVQSPRLLLLPFSFWEEGSLERLDGMG